MLNEDGRFLVPVRSTVIKIDLIFSSPFLYFPKTSEQNEAVMADMLFTKSGTTFKKGEVGCKAGCRCECRLK